MKRIEHGDCLDVMRQLAADGVRVSAIVTDPPYHLTAGKRGGSGPASENLASPAGRSRATTGFMGKAWDGGDVAFRVETWQAAYDLLLPGGHMLAFGGTRTFHRLACAIEDAGFELRDTIAWLYGTGFPKSLDVAKAIDKAAGRPIEVVPTGAPVKRMIPGADQAKQGWEKNNGREYQPGQFVPSNEAAPWQGWGTALKPAFEPICLARKPLMDTVARNVIAHGTGALNIDGCRVPTDRPRPARDRRKDAALDETRNTYGAGLNGSHAVEETSLGRWPANVVHDGSEEVERAFPDQVSGGTPPSRPRDKTRNTYGALGGRENPNGIGSTAGNAARFFYSAKADADDRLGSKHPTVKPVDLMRWLVRLVTPPGGIVLDPFAGSGSTAMACLAEGFDFIMIEKEAEHVADIRRRLAHVRGDDTPLFNATT